MPADRHRVLEHQLEGLALERETRVAQVGDGRRGAAARAAAPPSGAGARAGALVGAAGGTRRGPAHLRAGLVDVDADHAGELARERVDLRLVPDARDQAGRLAQRVDTAVGAVEVVLADHVGQHEPVERHPPGHQLAHRGVPALDAQVARVHARGLDRDVGLGDEVLVAAEGAQRGLLARGVAVEGEDHLAAELLVVVEEAPQHPRVLVAEGGAAGGHGGADAGQVAGHHVGVALDDHRLRRSGRSRGAPGRCRRAPGSSCRSASRRC